MFCDSCFDGDLSSWDIASLEYNIDMFKNSKFTGDISHWDVLNEYDEW